jgi:hypothetical protein
MSERPKRGPRAQAVVDEMLDDLTDSSALHPAEAVGQIEKTLVYQWAVFQDALHDLSLVIVPSPRIRRWLLWRS